MVDNLEWIVKHRLCAICWGGLVMKYIDGWGVWCSAHPEHTGNVSKRWVEIQRRNSILERAEVEMVYGDTLNSGRVKMSRSEASKLLYGDDSGLV